MAVQTQAIPNFEFSGFYYFDSLRDLLNYVRLNVPEITDESEEEPFIQIMRAWALSHHYANVRLDIVANETLLPTSRLLESVRSQLKLIDFALTEATPATTPMVMEFSSLFTTPILIVPQNSQFGTEDSDDIPQIIFEAVEDNTITRTDRLTYVYANPVVDITLSAKAGNLFQFTSTKVPKEGDLIIQNGNYAIVDELVDSTTLRLNDASAINNGAASLSTDNFSSDKSGEAVTPALPFEFTGSDPRPGDLLYLIHDSVMWDRIDLAVLQNYKTGMEGVWEFFDGNSEDANPDEVTNLGSQLRLDLTTLLGQANRAGTKVRVTLPQTSSSEEVTSKFVGGKNVIDTTGLLGQVSPSLSRTDYLVGTMWQPLEVADETYDSGSMSGNGVIQYALPQNIKQDWQKTTINDKTGFALRFRVLSLTKTAATFKGTAYTPGGLDSNNYNLKIKVDGYPFTEFDVTGDQGASSFYPIATIAANINAALAAVHSSLANCFTVESGNLKFTGPNAALGKDSVVTLEAPTQKDALNELFGFSETSYPYNFIGVGGKPILDLVDISQGKQYLLFNVVQGETTVEDPLASSNGSPNQTFVLTHSPIIDGTLTVEVDEGAGFVIYDRVENFLSSDESSKHYTLEITADDVATITFGDGVNGKIPPAGVDNVRAQYRIGADQNGNVGAQTISVNLAGISFVDRVYNPRQANGWAAKQGSSPESLAQLKIEGPASLRTLGKAITPPDIETLAQRFTSPSTGSKPVARSRAIEETFGVKTVELLVVGTSGALLNQGQREEIDEYFNGNKSKGIEGVLVTNHEVTTVNYTPRPIDVVVQVIGGNAESISNALKALLNPEAKYDDNVTYRWNFGGEIPRSLIIAAIHETDPVAVKKVQLIQPATDVVLGARELPLAANLSITIIPV